MEFDLILAQLYEKNRSKNVVHLDCNSYLGTINLEKKMCDLLQKLREGDLMSMVQNAAKINPQFKQFESLFGDLLKKK